MPDHMNKKQLLDQILSILYTVKEDEAKLQKILDFLLDEIFEEQKDEIVIPEKYQKLVHDVAENIDSGFICYINPETLEVEEIPKDMADDPEEYEMITGEKWDNSFKHESWDKCITIEPPESHDSFKIMEQFTNQVDDQKLQNRLIYALNHKKPFANFKNIVENSALREQWFAFKQHELEKYVWNMIQIDV